MLTHRPATALLTVAFVGGFAGVAVPARSRLAPTSPARPCAAGGLRGAFALVPGSSGAGHVVYDLKLTNRGRAPCTVSGRPGLQLLDRRGKRLPTHVAADRPGTGSAVLVTLARAHTALADARFSPDVPGPGESGSHPCEPTATRVRVTLASPGHGSLTASVAPPTPVCEHGRIVLGLLHARRR